MTTAILAPIAGLPGAYVGAAAVVIDPRPGAPDVLVHLTLRTGFRCVRLVPRASVTAPETAIYPLARPSKLR